MDAWDIHDQNGIVRTTYFELIEQGLHPADYDVIHGIKDDQYWDMVLSKSHLLNVGKNPKILCKIFGHNGPILIGRILSGNFYVEQHTIIICKRCGRIVYKEDLTYRKSKQG